MPNQLSPRQCQIFRYPGSKMRLAQNPQFQHLVDAMTIGKASFYEAFAGSLSVSLSMALRHPSMKFYTVEKDPSIASFWRIIGMGSAQQVEALKERLAKVPTVELFQHLRDSSPKENDIVEHAYRAVFFNRTTFSGIAKASPIGGKEQKSKWSVSCRWGEEGLLEKKIDLLRGLFHKRLVVYRGDVLDWLKDVPVDAALYLDPPYWVAGDALYTETMSAADHALLAQALKKKQNWLLSYDVCPEISRLYKDWAQMKKENFRYTIRGHKKQHGEGWTAAKEYLIAAKGVPLCK